MPLIKDPETGDLDFSVAGEFKFGYADQPLTLSLVSAMMNAAYDAGVNDAAPYADKLRRILREMPNG